MREIIEGGGGDLVVKLKDKFFCWGVVGDLRKFMLAKIFRYTVCSMQSRNLCS